MLLFEFFLLVVSSKKRIILTTVISINHVKVSVNMYYLSILLSLCLSTYVCVILVLYEHEIGEKVTFFREKVKISKKRARR